MAGTGIEREIARLFAAQRTHALHEITNMMAGIRKAKKPRRPVEGEGIWIGITPGSKAQDQLADDVAGYAVTEENIARIQHQLEVAAARSGHTFADEITIGNVNEALTREEQQTLRAMHTSLEANMRYYAKRFARERSAELVGRKYTAAGNLVDNPDAKWAISDTTRDTIREIIREAVAGRWNISTVAQKIEDSAVFSQARAHMVARTEVNRAMNSGVIEAARYAKDAGVANYKKAVITDGDPCELCIENEAVGEIDLDDDFPNDEPPTHPNCMCEIEITEAEPEVEKADDGDDYDEVNPLPESKLSKYRRETKKLVAAAKIDRSYHVLEIADRNDDGTVVYIDGHVPKRVSGIDTDVSLAIHELSEWLAMNDDLNYFDAHTRVANPLEKEYVGDKWDAYEKEFDKYLHESEGEEVKSVPPDLDLRPFEGPELKFMQRLVSRARRKG